MSTNQLRIAPARATHLDLYAAGLSALCIVHCLALPLLTSILPVVGVVSENPLVHKVLVLLAAPTTLWVVWKSLHTKRSHAFILAALLGIGLLLAGAFLEAAERYEEPLTVLGAVILAGLHLWRWTRAHRSAESTKPPIGS